MRKIPGILNCLFAGAVIWFATALISRYYLPKMPVLILSSVLAGLVAVGLILFALTRPARGDKSDRRDHALKLALYSLSPHSRQKFLAQILGFSYRIEVTSREILLSTEENTYLLFDFLRFRPVTADEICAAHYLATEHGHRPLVVADCLDKAALETANYLGVQVRTWGCARKFLEKNHAYPPLKPIPKQPLLKKLLIVALDKTRTKGYLLSAVVLLMSSIISPYAIYYQIVAVLCCLLACTTLVRRLKSPASN